MTFAAGYFDGFFFFSIVNVMAVFHHQLDNTFHEPFINVLVAKINNLKDKIVIKLKIPMI